MEVPMSPYGTNDLTIPPINLNGLEELKDVAVPVPYKTVNIAFKPVVQAGQTDKSIKEEECSPKIPHIAPAKRPRVHSSDDSSSEDDGTGPKKEVGLINELIERFLQEETITDEEWDKLKQEEKIILNCLLKRKLGFDIHEYIKLKGSLKETNVKCKRLEENYKMVFKGALKYLSANFKEKKGKKKSKAEDIAFYQHYFGQVANDSNPLETFFHPNK